MMHMLAVATINLLTNVYLYPFQRYDWGPKISRWFTWPWTHQFEKCLTWPTGAQNFKTQASAIPETQNVKTGDKVISNVIWFPICLS